jgi:ethanolamine utilization cobalamin adenosyltransferase
VILEGDAKEIVREINSPPPYLSRAGHFIDSITWSMQQCRFPHFRFASRQANSAAHELARNAACWG